VRLELSALRYGDYRQLLVDHRQLAFCREYEGRRVLVAVNAGSAPATLNLSSAGYGRGRMVDRLNEGEAFPVYPGEPVPVPVWSNWARILEFVPESV
jgi:hypothetical protein